MDKIEKFVEDLQLVDKNKAEIVETIRILVHKTNPNIGERFIYGGIGFFYFDRQIGGVYVSRSHVSVTLSNGKSLKDPKNLLLGSGIYRGYLKFTDPKDIDESTIKDFYEQAVDFENKSK
ncbi:MAG: hypothetical protein UW69_C0040G0019 [Microgenomates group bacterium GW2011_GWA2_44_7]|nr:MAG: hypothetical protein UW69_C0040G0019 [Microgenomates group bacterium GW2011_GWA2_44_7]